MKIVQLDTTGCLWHIDHQTLDRQHAFEAPFKLKKRREFGLSLCYSLDGSPAVTYYQEVDTSYLA